MLTRVFALPLLCWAIQNSHAGEFDAKIKPLLSQRCYDCHGDGMNKGSVVLDEFKSEQQATLDRMANQRRARLSGVRTKPN